MVKINESLVKKAIKRMVSHPEFSPLNEDTELLKAFIEDDKDLLEELEKAEIETMKYITERLTKDSKPEDLLDLMAEAFKLFGKEFMDKLYKKI